MSLRVPSSNGVLNDSIVTLEAAANDYVNALANRIRELINFRQQVAEQESPTSGEVVQETPRHETCQLSPIVIHVDEDSPDRGVFVLEIPRQLESTTNPIPVAPKDKSPSSGKVVQEDLPGLAKVSPIPKVEAESSTNCVVEVEDSRVSMFSSAADSSKVAHRHLSTPSLSKVNLTVEIPKRTSVSIPDDMK
jgi:hypothetical protein